uniref:protein kintoun n=1 Tax=Myxine glutinosa TaxID=7769 RepID=UPI00358F6078
MKARKKLEKFEPTPDEVKRLTKAFEDEKFKGLVREFAEEVTSEQSRQLYEAEVTALEKERGSNVTFLHSTPGFVLKTSDGEQKCFINVCSDDAVNRPTYKREQGSDGSWGMRYQFPNALVPPKEDKDNAGRRCVVYDVVFHSETLALVKNPRVHQLLVKTALDMVEKTFSVTLDRHNLRRLKMPYKGVPGSTVLRRPLYTTATLPYNDPPLSFPFQGSPPERPMSMQNRNPEEEYILNLKEQCGKGQLKNYTKVATPLNKKVKEQEYIQKPEKVSSGVLEDRARAHMQPCYSIKYRGFFDIQDYHYGRDAGPGVHPQELEINIDLPLLRSSNNIDLQVFQCTLTLKVLHPKYFLDIQLPYPILDTKGHAVFNNTTRCLTVTLPVLLEEKLPIVSSNVEDDAMPNEQKVLDNRASPEEESQQTAPQILFTSQDFVARSGEGVQAECKSECHFAGKEDREQKDIIAWHSESVNVHGQDKSVTKEGNHGSAGEMSKSCNEDSEMKSGYVEPKSDKELGVHEEQPKTEYNQIMGWNDCEDDGLMTNNTGIVDSIQETLLRPIDNSSEGLCYARLVSKQDSNEGQKQGAFENDFGDEKQNEVDSTQSTRQNEMQKVKEEHHGGVNAEETRNDLKSKREENERVDREDGKNDGVQTEGKGKMGNIASEMKNVHCVGENMKGRIDNNMSIEQVKEDSKKVRSTEEGDEEDLVTHNRIENKNGAEKNQVKEMVDKRDRDLDKQRNLQVEKRDLITELPQDPICLPSIQCGGTDNATHPGQVNGDWCCSEDVCIPTPLARDQSADGLQATVGILTSGASESDESVRLQQQSLTTEEARPGMNALLGNNEPKGTIVEMDENIHESAIEPQQIRDACGGSLDEGDRSQDVGPPALREISADGSEHALVDHTTHCPISFQNNLLFQLD